MVPVSVSGFLQVLPHSKHKFSEVCECVCMVPFRHLIQGVILTDVRWSVRSTLTRITPDFFICCIYIIRYIVLFTHKNIFSLSIANNNHDNKNNFKKKCYRKLPKACVKISPGSFILQTPPTASICFSSSWPILTSWMHYLGCAIPQCSLMWYVPDGQVHLGFLLPWPGIHSRWWPHIAQDIADFSPVAFLIYTWSLFVFCLQVSASVQYEHMLCWYVCVM